MSIFKPVTLQWKGNEYTVAADNVMMMIAKVEDILTLPELMNPKGRPLAKIAMAYGEALRHAGAKVRDDEVYSAMFTHGEQAHAASDAVNGLLMMMVPPSAISEQTPAKSEKKAKPSKGASSS